MRRQLAAFRPGTKANHKSTLVKFVRFCAMCRTDFTNPDYETICMYFEYCLDTVKSPDTIKNYLAALTSTYRQMGVDSSPFDNFRVKLAIKSIEKNVRHVPEPSLPVSPRLLKKAVRIISRLEEGASVVAALVIMYHTFFRQSNLAASTALQFDHTRQLTRDDVKICGDRLLVKHKWSKNHQIAGKQSQVVIPAVPGSLLCPKQAVQTMTRVIPTRHPHQPFITFRDGGHMPLSYIRKIWGTVLQALGTPNYHAYTLHGLRRGAATHVYQQDPSAREEIKAHGLWRSDAVDRYIPHQQSKVFNLLRDTL